MKRAVGPFYRDKPVHTFTDDELVAAIENSRREGIEAFVNEACNHINFCWSRREIGEMFERDFGLEPGAIGDQAVRKLQENSPEGWGDAAARIYDSEYKWLWNEALDRSDYLVDRARVDGGWCD
jgi:hypothetical protein